MNTIARKIIIFFFFALGGLLVNALGPFVIYFLYASKIITIDYAGVLSGTFFPITGYIIIVGGFIFIFLHEIVASINKLTSSERPNSRQKEIDEIIKQKYENEPEDVPIWVLMQSKLEAYLDRNLSQINSIFWFSVIVMSIGFIFILIGIAQSFVAAQPGGTTQKVVQAASSNITPALIGGIAGTITEFIGATFLFIYRSTIQQASEYMKMLERINTVGMAMDILESISSDSGELRDKTKAEIVKVILSASDGSLAMNSTIPSKAKPANQNKSPNRVKSSNMAATPNEESD